MNAGGIVNTGAMVNLTTAPEPLSVSVVTTQSTMPATLGHQSGSAVPVTCAAVNISTSQLPISNPPRNDVHPAPVSIGLLPHIPNTSNQRQSILPQTSLWQHQGMSRVQRKPSAS